MKTITMATLKGGAGKTMNTFNIAGILAEKHRVLLIDVDPQCNLSSNCGIDIADESSFTVKDIFENLPKDQPDLNKIITKHPIPELKNLDIIPSSIMLFRTEKDLFAKSDRERILEKYFIKNKEGFSDYDYVIIDTNPSMSFININAFLVADEIILSCDVSANSLTGAELFCSLWDETREELGKEDNISAMIISNYDSRTKLARELAEFSEEASFSRDILLNTRIKTTVRLKETETAHAPINVVNPTHDACVQYRNVVKELKQKGVI